MLITDKAMQERAPKTDIWHIEDGPRGAGRLVGRITPAGTRTFYFRYQASNGERVRLLIGTYAPRGDGAATYTVQQARDRARELSALYRSGIRDLREHFARLEADRLAAEEAERQRITDELRQRDEAAAAAARRLTVKQLFDQWQRAELAPQVLADGTRTGRKDGGQWVRESFERRVFTTMGDRRADQVTRADLLALIDASKAEGKLRTAQVLLADLRQMFRFAAEREVVARNPLEGLKRTRVAGRAVERDRALSDDEVRMLLREVIPTARLHPRTAAAIRVVLATGVRAGELAGAVWADALPDKSMLRQRRIAELRAIAEDNDVKLGIVDVAARRWHLHDTKNGRDHEIHLSTFAVEEFTLLASLRETCEDGTVSPWVFPATVAALPVSVKSIGKQLSDRQREPERRLANRTKATQALALPGGRWTMHDLRRTAATIMARLGIGSDVIDEALNHVLQSRVTRIYIRDRRHEAQAVAFDALGRRLQELYAPTRDVQTDKAIVSTGA